MAEHDLDLKLIKERLIQREGMVLSPYHCKSNKLSIGVGRNLQDNGITKEEALYLLDHDIQETINKLDKQWPIWSSFPQAAQHVCVDVVFNMGINTWMSFRKTRAYMEMGEWEKAGDELLNSKYAQQVGSRAVLNSEELKSLQE